MPPTSGVFAVRRGLWVGLRCSSGRKPTAVLLYGRRAGRRAPDGFTNVYSAEQGSIYKCIDLHIQAYRPAYTSVKGGGGAGGRRGSREEDRPAPSLWQRSREEIHWSAPDCQHKQESAHRADSC